MNTLSEFQSYLSESFFRRIHLFEKIIGNRHWLTTGTYKEKILLSFLNDALPKKLKAKPGFIIFPCGKRFSTKEVPEKYDALNSSAYEMSRQIDIVIYDHHNFPPIHDDQDLVIVGPESVRAVIEVKGSLSRKHLTDAINLLNDFSQKWAAYKRFRDNHSLDSQLTKTKLYIFAWETKTKNNRRLISGKTVRKILAGNLRANANPSSIEHIPIIDKVLIYNDYEVDFLYYVGEGEHSAGYMTGRGQYIVFDDQGEPQKAGDKTIFSLLRDILSSNELLYNRFLVDPDETSYTDILPHNDSGYDKAFDIES